MKSVTGSAGLTAPGDIRAVLNRLWRLHAADAASSEGLRTARPSSGSWVLRFPVHVYNYLKALRLADRTKRWITETSTPATSPGVD